MDVCTYTKKCPLCLKFKLNREVCYFGVFLFLFFLNLAPLREEGLEFGALGGEVCRGCQRPGLSRLPGEEARTPFLLQPPGSQLLAQALPVYGAQAGGVVEGTPGVSEAELAYSVFPVPLLHLARQKEFWRQAVFIQIPFSLLLLFFYFYFYFHKLIWANQHMPGSKITDAPSTPSWNQLPDLFKRLPQDY